MGVIQRDRVDGFARAAALIDGSEYAGVCDQSFVVSLFEGEVVLGVVFALIGAGVVFALLGAVAFTALNGAGIVFALIGASIVSAALIGAGVHVVGHDVVDIISGRVRALASCVGGVALWRCA